MEATVNEDGITIPVIKTPPTISQRQEEANNARLFTEDEVEKIRQQEKSKMYKRIEDADVRVKSMEEQLTVLSQERESAMAEAAERARKEAEILRQREMEELSAKELMTRKETEFNSRLSEVEQQWQSKFEQIEQARAAQEALLEKERAMQALDRYRQQRIAEEEDNIMPELRDLIVGNSEEEIENAVAVLRDRSNAIMESIQQAAQINRPRGAPVTAPPVGPLDNQMENQTFSAEDIRNMPMDQYAKMRDRLLSARAPGRGRF